MLFVCAGTCIANGNNYRDAWCNICFRLGDAGVQWLTSPTVRVGDVTG